MENMIRKLKCPFRSHGEFNLQPDCNKYECTMWNEREDICLLREQALIMIYGNRGESNDRDN